MITDFFGHCKSKENVIAQQELGSEKALSTDVRISAIAGLGQAPGLETVF